jgi:hypothetical protein
VKTLAILIVAIPLLGGLVLTACPAPGPVAPPNPDASDAASYAADAPSTPGSPACAAACAHLITIGCGQIYTCPSTLTKVEADRMLANPANGRRPLTCADLSAAASVADVQARGWNCVGAGLR